VNTLLRLSLQDAKNNCQRQGARARLTLRSGVQLVGRINTVDDDHVHLKQRDVSRQTEQGWATVETDEIVAVEVFK